MTNRPLDAGCRAVWVVDPKSCTVTVYHNRRQIVVVSESDTLDGGDVVPGLHVRVADFFMQPRAEGGVARLCVCASRDLHLGESRVESVPGSTTFFANR